MRPHFPPPHNPFPYLLIAGAMAFVLFVCAASAQDPALPKDPPASTLNSDPPTLYSQWVTTAKYYYKKAQAPSVAFSGIDVIKVTVLALKSDLKIEWDYVNQGQTGFTVERSTDGTTFATLATLEDPAARAYTDKGLAAGSYWYRVRAYKPAEISAPSNVATRAIP